MRSGDASNSTPKSDTKDPSGKSLPSKVLWSAGMLTMKGFSRTSSGSADLPENGKLGMSSEHERDGAVSNQCMG